MPLSDDLLAVLRQVRNQLARDAGIPAYQVFSNATLEDMARKRPTDVDGFLSVSGVGQRKAHKYAAPFLDAVRAWQQRQ